MMTIEIIMRYLKDNQDYGLWYKKGGNFELNSFIDVQWDGIIDDRMRTSGVELFLGKNLVS
jgi:hypothetical protein